MKTLLVGFIIFIFILISIALITYYIWLCYQYPKYIDAVYTWVENDNNTQTELQNRQITNLQANYTNNDELLYSLRSLARYAQWFHHIYIVVRDGQKPKWLNEKHPKISIIYHSQIIPQKYLPTISSITIEVFLHFIPNLSEHYVYFNDDMILLNKTWPGDFFNIYGKPIESKCHLVRKGKAKITVSPESIQSDYDEKEYNFEEMIYYNNVLLDYYFKVEKRYQSQHLPNPCRKSFMLSLDKFLDNFDLETITPTRKNTNIARNSIFKKYWNIYKYNCPQKIFPMDYIEINHLRSVRQQINEIRHSWKKFFCVQNSIAYGDINEHIGTKDFAYLQKILQEKFPNRSPFEK
jgi:hypothetical protein